MLKLNLGCGNKIKKDFVNVDKFEIFNPDVIHDLEEFPYPFDNNSTNFILLSHVLEHIGGNFETFNNIIKELYRISANNCIIEIRVPHPRHDDYLSDPSHVRPITDMTLELYDKELNIKWKNMGAANTKLALINNVNFKIIEKFIKLEPQYADDLNSGKINLDQINVYIKKYNNVIKETQYKLKVIKDI